MTPLFNKLNLGEHRSILVLNSPETFEGELGQLSGVTIQRDAKRLSTISFAIAFVQTIADLEAAAKWLPKAKGDAIVWFAYPKKSSKRYQCEFNRDSGWEAIGAAGFEGVRMVAIDEDWAALRFRRTEFIKSMKRDPSRAKSPEGQSRTKKGQK